LYNEKVKPILTALSLLAFLAVPGVSRPADDANLLIITVDTLRADRLSCYSQAFVKTPAVDALAAGGALFERAFAHCPTTLPSHVNIMTGMTPLFHGVHENSKSKAPPECLTLAEHLKSQGFATAAFIGAFPLVRRFGLDQGFDLYDDRLPFKPALLGTFSERKAGDVVSAALDWISSRQGKWFCWIHLWDPHAPYAPPEPFLTRYHSDPYSGEAAYVDAELGTLFESLRAHGLADKTFIVLTADHGESLGDHGELTHSYFAYNSTLHVPLIVGGPGVRPLRVTGNVCHTDIFPTVCELLGVPVPKDLQGRSLVAAMKSRTLKGRPIYFESLEPYLNERVAPLRGFIDGDLKYIDSPLPEVYDLAADFNETRNLAMKKDLEPLKKELAGLVSSLSSTLAAGEGKAVDRETLERLRSLGYITSSAAQVKSSYVPADDLKNFLPFHRELEQAILIMDQGRLDESTARMAALVEKKPTFVPVYIYLSMARRAQHRLPDAVRVLEEGVKANPDDFTLLSALGEFLIQAGQWDTTIEVLDKAVTIIDYDPEVWDNLGVASMVKRDYDKAVTCFDRALSLDETFVLALANMGRVRQVMYFDRGRNPEDLSLSIEFFQKAVARDPGFVLGWRGLGGSFWAGGRNDEAMEAWTKAIALDPEDDFSILHLGNLYLQKGDKKTALGLFERYLKVKGDKITPRERQLVDGLIEQCQR
jgi:arylsulfatase A-like enzyme/Flp pilus assembly protein TadD